MCERREHQSEVGAKLEKGPRPDGTCEDCTASTEILIPIGKQMPACMHKAEAGNNQGQYFLPFKSTDFWNLPQFWMHVLQVSMQLTMEKWPNSRGENLVNSRPSRFSCPKSSLRKHSKLAIANWRVILNRFPWESCAHVTLGTSGREARDTLKVNQRLGKA